MLKTKINLMELCLSPDLGGLELYMVNAAKALKGAFNVISVINTDSKLEAYYRENDDRYAVIAKKSNLIMFKAAYRLAELIDKHEIDIVHMHWTKDLPFVVLAKKLSKRRPRIVQTRHMRMTRFKDDFYHRWLYSNVDVMIAVTNQVKEELQTFIPGSVRPQLEMIYPGVKLPALLSDEALRELKTEIGMTKAFNLGMVGRIEEAKGQYLLIEAVALLRQNNVDVEAYFVGHEMEEGYTQSLIAKAEALQVGSFVHFLGFMDNPAAFMQACDAIVLATPCETFGLVVVEAMAVKTPVIATNRCGPLEIIEHGVSGLLFEKDESRSLCEQIVTLQDREKAKAMSEAALQRVREKFSFQTQFETLKRLFEDL